MRATTIYLFLLSCAISSCQLFKSAETLEIKNTEKVITLERGACFGTCAVFDLTVYKNGIAEYVGREFTDKQGTHIRKLREEEMDKLEKQLLSMNFWDYQTIYKSRIPDLPTLAFTYYEGGRNKTVSGKENLPTALVELENILSNIAISGEWKAQRESGTSREDESEEGDDLLPYGIVADRLVVELEDYIDAKLWAREYAPQKLKARRKLNSESNTWLFSYSTKRIAPLEMLKLVQQDNLVRSADFKQK